MKWIYVLVLAVFIASCSEVVIDTPTDVIVDDVVVDEKANDVVDDTYVAEVEESCTPEIFNYPPLELSKVKFITPLGLMTDSHVTPVDHQYYSTDELTNIISPGDGIITEFQHMGTYIGDKSGIDVNDYRMVIDHGCGIESIYIHIDNLEPQFKTRGVKVKAGEILGSYEGSVDYNVVDRNQIFNVFIVPEHYKQENWKVHTPDPFNYFKDNIKEEMIQKSLRSTPPYGGEISYDKEGYLSGNWFEENTKGYEGINIERYWAGHLTFGYDHIDPEALIISIGTFEGKAKQFVATGPDFREVNEGIVKYELYGIDFEVNGERWDRQTLVKNLKTVPTQDIEGTVLVEILNNKIRFEASKETLTEFSSNAKIYER